MKPVIIGIHGLRNKPSKTMLSGWWQKAMREGAEVINLPLPSYTFEMAYWAHHLHQNPQDPHITDRNHAEYLHEPYVSGIRFGPRDPKRQLTRGVHDQIMQLIAGPAGLMNINLVSNIILHRMFIELDIYYHHTIPDTLGSQLPAKHLIRSELTKVLKKYRHRKILLLAHSMGTIIAYDVLSYEVPDIPIDTFITMGSPLGFPVILAQTKIEQGRNKDDRDMLPTPPSIRHRWLNFSDLDDVTCLNYNLRNNYTENSHGVRPFDYVVYNNYEHKGEPNPHKSYGYLRTAMVTQALFQFLRIENASFLTRLGWLFRPPRM